MAKVQLGVIFGSRSCEREVSIISAVQLMNHVDSEKYDVIPVYIGENGVWYTGNALRRIETYTPFDPNKAGIEAVALDVTAGSGALLANRPGKGLFSHPTQVMVARLEVCVIVMHGLNGEDGTLQGMLELANLPYTSTGVAGSAIGMDKIMMKQFFRGDAAVSAGLLVHARHVSAGQKRRAGQGGEGTGLSCVRQAREPRLVYRCQPCG